MTDTIDLTSYGWPASQLHQAMSVLARKAGLLSLSPDTLSGYHGPADNDIIEQWMAATTQQIGIESEAVEISYAELEQKVQLIGPALIRLPGEETPRFLAVLKGCKKGIKVITPNDTVRHVPLTPLRDVLAYDLEAPITPTIATLLADAGVPEARQAATGNSANECDLNLMWPARAVSIPPSSAVWWATRCWPPIWAGKGRIDPTLFG
ncbi:MAG: hypothetical protein DRR19_14120 [Candidatus Parabeggiatoa sp. nov. 1]|nr:MAG: hypothetical protein DRR19_14120 [Gammaproteobacteria bacterium]HEC85318.1 hypothetical protein [Thioploca sp.]